MSNKISCHDAAKILGVAVKSVMRWVESGELNGDSKSRRGMKRKSWSVVVDEKFSEKAKRRAERRESGPDSARPTATLREVRKEIQRREERQVVFGSEKPQSFDKLDFDPDGIPWWENATPLEKTLFEKACTRAYRCNCPSDVRLWEKCMSAINPEHFGDKKKQGGAFTPTEYKNIMDGIVKDVGEATVAVLKDISEREGKVTSEEINRLFENKGTTK